MYSEFLFLISHRTKNAKKALILPLLYLIPFNSELETCGSYSSRKPPGLYLAINSRISCGRHLFAGL